MDKEFFQKMAGFIDYVNETPEAGFPGSVLEAADKVNRLQEKYADIVRNLDRNELFGGIGNLMYQVTIARDIKLQATKNLQPFSQTNQQDIERRLSKAIDHATQRILLCKLESDCPDKDHNIVLSKSRFFAILRNLIHSDTRIVDEELQHVADTVLKK